MITARALFFRDDPYFIDICDSHSPRLQKRVVDKDIHIIDCEDNPAVTRGITLVLDQLSSKLVAPSITDLNTLRICLNI